MWLQTTEASAGAWWSLKRRASSPPLPVITSCCWLNLGAWRSVQADALVTWRMTNAVCQHLHRHKCMRWHGFSRTHRALGWDSNCPRDQMNVDNCYRGLSRTPLVFHNGGQRPGCRALNDTVMSNWSGEVCLILIGSCLMWFSGTAAFWDI